MFRFTIANHTVEIDVINGNISALKFIATNRKQDAMAANELNYCIAAETVRQMEEYFCGKRTRFDVPVLLRGTNFQMKVWEGLSKVPYGETISYSALASEIGRPEAVRAVANAVAKNPVAIIIPCHRVITKGGKLGGFAWGTDLKRELLKIEGVDI